MPGFVEQKDVKYYGKLLEGHLTQHEPLFFKLDEAENWGYNPNENFHTSTADLELGLEEFAYYTKEHFGMAGFYDGMSNDIPIVDVQAGELGRVKTAMLINGARWSYFTLKKMEAAQKVGFNVPLLDVVADSQEAMGTFINRRTHEIILYGAPNRGMYGLYSQPQITQMKIDVNLYTASTEQLYKIFLTIIQAFTDVSLITNARMQDWKIPERLLKRMAEPYTNVEGVLNGYTLYKMITSSDMGYNINSLTSARENSGANLVDKEVIPSDYGNRDRIIIKTTTPCLQRKFYARQQFAPQKIDSVNWEQVSFAATTGLFAPRPNRIMYVDFLNGN